MKTISLKIDESNFEEIETILSRLNKPRNRYINEAIAFYNKFQRRALLEKTLLIESNLVKEDSIAVLNDFNDIEYAD